jgi:ABC-type glutathione transport system ATPase component
LFQDLLEFYDKDLQKIVDLGKQDHQELNGIFFSYAVSWVFGMRFFDRFSKENKKQVQSMLKQKISKIYTSFPLENDIFDYFVDFKQRRLNKWDKLMPGFLFDPKLSFKALSVPTRDTVKFVYNIKMQVRHAKSMLLMGVSGAGKTSILNLFTKSVDQSKNVLIFQNFSAITASGQIYDVFSDRDSYLWSQNVVR